jgi:glutamine amidotransferase
MIGIVPYNNSNYKTVFAAIDYLGFDAILISSKKDFLKCKKLILPGVGSFGPALDWIRNLEIEDHLVTWIKTGNHALGICLGLQILGNSSEESPGYQGLGILNCSVRKIRSAVDNSEGVHTGFNEIKFKDTYSLLHGIRSNFDFYFNHSFFISNLDKNLILGNAEFNNFLIPAYVRYNNFIGTQFHPEKSHNNGLRLLHNFCEGRSI